MIGPLAKYLIIAKLGAGGMGEVYKAQDPVLLRTVAIKVIPKRQPGHADAEQRFLREARAASALNHPNIVTIYELGETQDEVFIVMEYVEGRSLRELLSACKLRPDQISNIALQMCSALEEAHSHGLIHRDIKPENVLLTDRGHIKIVDFGLAKNVPGRPGGLTLDESLTEAGTVMGTLSYMSPEQLRGEPLDERTDIFSFGIVTYELITGRLPFAGETPFEVAASILKDQAQGIAQVPAGVPLGIEKIVSRLLEKDRNKRYRSFGDVRLEIEKLLQTRDATATTVDLSAAGPASMPIKPSGTAVPTILVLPLETVGGGEGSHIGIGLAHAITTDLAKIAGLSVLSKSAAASIAGGAGPGARQLAIDLGATILFEGEVVRSGPTIGVMARLTDVVTNRVIWGSQYRGDVADLFSIQDAVCESVATALQVSISSHIREELARPATRNIEAFELYSQGRAFLERRDVAQNIDNAICVLQEALRLDAGFALAHAGLGEAFWHKYQATQENEWVDRAISATDHALVLDPSQPRVYISLGIIYHGTGRIERAMEHFERAINLQPTSDEAHQWLGRCFMRLGDLESAVRYFEKAIEIRPGYWENYSALGTCYYTFGRYRDAAEQFRRVITFQADNYLGYDNLGGIYYLLGLYEDAAVMYRRAIDIYPNHRSYANLGTTCFYTGQYEEAIKAYRAAIEFNSRDDSHHVNLGDVYLRLGRRLESEEEFKVAAGLLKARLSVNPDDAQVLGRLAVCQAKLGQREHAFATIGRAVELEKHNTTIMYQKAVVCALCRDFENAVAWLSRALAHGYSQSEARQDPDLESLRGRSDYETLFESDGPG